MRVATPDPYRIFRYPAPADFVGPGQFAPNSDTFRKWTRKVKSWGISAEIYYDGILRSSKGYGLRDGQRRFLPTFNFSGYNDEREKYNRPSPWGSFINGGFTGGPGGGPTDGLIARVGPTGSVVNKAIDFYLNIAAVWDAPEGEPGAGFFTNTSRPGFDTAVEIPLNFDGVETQMYSDETTFLNGVTCIPVVSPAEWWVYDREDTTHPIYAEGGGQLIPITDPEFYLDSWGNPYFQPSPYLLD